MRDKINILFVLPNFDTGGSEKLVFDIIKDIDKNKFAPVLCVFFSGSYEPEFLKLNIPFYVIHKDGLRSKLSTIAFLNQIIRKHSVHIVNTHHSSPLIQGFIPFKILNNIKWAHTEHSRLDRIHSTTPKILFLTKICLKFVDIFIGISQGVCDYFKNEVKIPQSKIITILNGIDISRFQFETIESTRIKEEYKQNLKMNNNEVVIGLFANFRREKNHEMLIKAADLLVKEGITHFKIVLAGTGPELENIKALTCALCLEPCVLFLGARHDIPELMNIIDIYCLPSHFEGLPFSLLEAMAAKKPIAATKVEGINELVTDGKNGLLVTKNNEVELANALKKLILNSAMRADMGANGFNFAKNLTFQTMLRAYEDLFWDTTYPKKQKSL